MSVDWWGWGWEHGPPNGDHRYVWQALANHADKQGTCFPSITCLVKETRKSESFVRRAVNSLVADGWVIRTERGNGRGKRTHYQLVKRVSDGDPLLSASVTEKGSEPGAEKVSERPEKGVTLTEPPHPLIGVTVIEPSEGNGRGNRHARAALSAPAPNTDAGFRPGACSDEEYSAAYRIFWSLKAPADENTIGLAAQAVHFEAERLGSIQAAEASILKAAKVEQTCGGSRWKFWFEDQGYRPRTKCALHH